MTNLNEPNRPDENRDFSSTTNLSDLNPGQYLLEKYEVLEVIGKGGMGKVYKVRQLFLDKILALKLLDLAASLNEVQVRRFQIEAKAAFSLNHPNLVKVYDFGLLGTGEPYLAMDFIDGIDLKTYIKKNGPLDPEVALQVFLQVCSGLAYAHQHSVIHRDVKPSNIMLDKHMPFSTTGSIKIVDFGIAKLGAHEGGEIQALTKTGEVFGSPLYMSPEQCSGEVVDCRSDIYSLGCSLFEALTGTPPHVGSNALRTMMLHKNSQAPLLKEASLGKQYTAELENVVQKMLMISAADRYQNMEEVANDLRDLIENNSPRKALQSKQFATGHTKKPLSKLKMIVASAACLIVLLIVGQVLLTLSTKQNFKASAPASTGEVDDLSVPIPVLYAHKMQEIHRQQLVYAEKAFNNAAPIISVPFERNGRAMLRINFPEVAIGDIENNHIGIDYSNFKEKIFRVEAKGKTEIPLSKYLRLILGAKHFETLKLPTIIKKISPEILTELQIKGDKEDVISDESFDKLKQEKNLTVILDSVASWTKLDAVEIDGIDLFNDNMKALNNLKSLSYFKLMNSDSDWAVLASQPFLKKLRYLSLDGCANDEVVAALAGSKYIENVRLSGAPLSSRTIENLSACPNLTKIDLQPENLSEDSIKKLSKIKKLSILGIHNTPLHVEQIEQLLSSCHSLKELILTGISANPVRKHEIQNPKIRINEPVNEQVSEIIPIDK